MRKVMLFLSVALVSLITPAFAQTPVSTHPRLWIRADDLPRLRSWASDANPVYRDGLALLAERAKQDMDGGNVRSDPGNSGYTDYPTEMYAELFAFMSLISPNEAARNDYAQRARTLLMTVINEAAKGVGEGPFRAADFSWNDRSRWNGEAFALTVDWIYPSLSASDKATIRQVFLRWANEMLTESYKHPLPVGVINDPQLLSDRIALRWAANNYFDAHMRNLGMRAMAFDPADDPDGALAGNLRNAIGAWLYMADALLRGDARGGLGPEGFEYYPQSMGYTAQFLLALKTAGQDDPSRWGSLVVLNNNPFWKDVMPAYLHSISPRTVPDQGGDPVYQPAWFGSGQNYWAADPIGMFAPLAIYDPSRADAVRWIEQNVPPGGAAGMIDDRIRRAGIFLDAIFYFLLFDPAAQPPSDPRPSLPLLHFAPGFGRLLVRTDWSPDARWFTYSLGWMSIDHQVGDGNNVEFYRKGEWLMKHRVGYDFDYATSDGYNTLALENDRVNREPGHLIYVMWQRGSQFMLSPAGDPNIVAQSSGADFVYAAGDATPLYNSPYENVTDIAHASRSVFWLQPDHIVIYDRASSKTGGRFKRFFVSVPTQPVVSGHRATMTTAHGQQLFVTSLLPADGVMTAEELPVEMSGDPANLEFIRWRLRVEAPGGPQTARFLHVLQGADAGANADAVTLIQASAFTGAVVRNTVVLFPNELSSPLSTITYSVPSTVASHRVTGLTPNGAFAVSTRTVGSNVEVTITSGGTARADSGGVLTFGDSSQTAPRRRSVRH